MTGRSISVSFQRAPLLDLLDRAPSGLQVKKPKHKRSETIDDLKTRGLKSDPLQGIAPTIDTQNKRRESIPYKAGPTSKPFNPPTFDPKWLPQPAPNLQDLPPPPSPLAKFTTTENSILHDQNDLIRLAEALGTVSSSQEFKQEERETLGLLLKQCASFATRTMEDCDQKERLAFYETRDLASDLLIGLAYHPNGNVREAVATVFPELYAKRPEETSRACAELMRHVDPDVVLAAIDIHADDLKTFGEKLAEAKNNPPQDHGQDCLGFAESILTHDDPVLRQALFRAMDGILTESNDSNLKSAIRRLHNEQRCGRWGFRTTSRRNVTLQPISQP